MEWLERQAFPQTATGKQLDLHGAQRGVLRKQAEKAAGVVSFSRYLPLSFDLVVPKGTLCATSGEPVVEYATTEEAVLQAGELTVDVPVEAVVAGAAGNAAAGYVTTLVGAPVGINYAANESPITGGQDPEEDEAYRKRILDAWAHSPNGTNADYYREIALNREGITSVQVVPRSSGAGTVALYLWGEDAAPSNDTIAALKADLDAQREVGVTVTVQAARAVQVSVLVNIQLSEELDLEQAKEDIEAALREFSKALAWGRLPVDGHQPGGALRCPGGKAGIPQHHARRAQCERQYPPAFQCGCGGDCMSAREHLAQVLEAPAFTS